MRLLPYGDRAILVELASTQEALAFATALADADPDGAEQVVPAARTVLVVAAEGRSLADLRRTLSDVEPAQEPLAGPAEETVEVPVVYDGEDLEDVATLTGLSASEVVAAHTGQLWRVGFGGFAPGFAYLLAQDDRLHVPRRDEPRTTVPRGAVGLAGEYSGVYPTSSPGGWQLIGRTDVMLWDVAREPPALLRPGVAVRFVEVSS